MDSLQSQVVSEVKTEEDFYKLVKSGMFWEWFPECDGTYENFVKCVKGGK